MLGLIDQHYFAVKKVAMTKYSVTHYFDICDKEDFHLLFPNGVLNYQRIYKGDDLLTRGIPLNICMNTKTHT